MISGWARLGCCLLELVLRVATLQLGWLIWALMLADRGQTPAKQLLGYRVVHAETFRTVGLGRMFFMRFLIGGIVAAFAIVCSLGVLLFMPFWDKRRQNLWDKVSNTLVINVNPTGLR
ncbi:MAG: hypothetical protein JWN99_1500 [Ilumatobacteraceae bacterium]|nr:hypothetical protein [Ilumatobacteraceae bacterium]